MQNKSGEIREIRAREILDSRGMPTIEAVVELFDGTRGVASVPSGASVGKYEAVERRDVDSPRYGGKSVLGTARGVEELISPALFGRSVFEQAAIDRALCELDGTKNKERLGANATLAVSLASARAAALCNGIPLFASLGGSVAKRLPVPMFNVINGGLHADNNLEIQEFMILPTGSLAFCEALHAGAEIYRTLKKILSKKGYSTGVGDEGGFAPDLKCDEEAIELLCEAVAQTGYKTEDVKIALDVAASGWAEDKIYKMPKSGKALDSDELIGYYERLISEYPIISIEDGLGEDDEEGFISLTERLGGKIMLVGDDLFVTNEERLKRGIAKKYANTILIKPNQIGTLTETLNVIDLARRSGYKYIISHRSGETNDAFIADLAVATGAPFIKAGAPCRGERLAKYNRLTEIEASLGCGALYGDRNK